MIFFCHKNFLKSDKLQDTFSNFSLESIIISIIFNFFFRFFFYFIWYIFNFLFYECISNCNIIFIYNLCDFTICLDYNEKYLYFCDFFFIFLNIFKIYKSWNNIIKFNYKSSWIVFNVNIFHKYIIAYFSLLILFYKISLYVYFSLFYYIKCSFFHIETVMKMDY